jgi:hypothetical protein
VSLAGVTSSIEGRTSSSKKWWWRGTGCSGRRTSRCCANITSSAQLECGHCVELPPDLSSGLISYPPTTTSSATLSKRVDYSCSFSRRNAVHVVAATPLAVARKAQCHNTLPRFECCFIWHTRAAANAFWGIHSTRLFEEIAGH